MRIRHAASMTNGRTDENTNRQSNVYTHTHILLVIHLGKVCVFAAETPTVQLPKRQAQSKNAKCDKNA